MNRIQAINVRDMLPSSISFDEHVQALSEVFTLNLLEVVNDIDLLLLLPNLSKLSDAVVDQLAWHLHVDFYNPLERRDIREQLVYQSIAWHRKKGTIGIVEDMATLISDDSEVIENWEYGGEPYHFKIKIQSNEQFDTAEVEKVVDAISTVKNVRSWIDAVEFERIYESTMYVGGRMAFSKIEVIA